MSSRAPSRRKSPGSRRGAWFSLGGALLVLLASVTGCGYSMGSLVRDDIRKVSVTLVENPTFRRDLEFLLTADLKAAILSRTELRIVDESQADVVLVGRILNVREQVLIEDRVDNVAESSVLITVEFRAVDQRDGTEKTVRLTDRAEFLTGRGEDFASATEESFTDLSEALVYNLLETPL